jgi:hypothetical protein
LRISFTQSLVFRGRTRQSFATARDLIARQFTAAFELISGKACPRRSDDAETMPGSGHVNSTSDGLADCYWDGFSKA